MGFFSSVLGTTSLKSKLIMFGLVAVVLGGGYYVYSQKMQILKAKEETLQIKGERDQAVKDRDVAVSVNKTTNETLDKIIQERKDAVASVNALANRDKTNKMKIDKLNEIIEELSTYPEAKEELSTILKETVRKIQEDREGVQK